MAEKYGAIHKVVKSGSTGWEGLYIYSDEGTYFEILCENQPYIQAGQLGIALSSRHGSPDLKAHLATLESRLDVYDRLDENNNLWFKAYSLNDLPEIPKAYVWYMDYQTNYQIERFNKKSNKVKRFKQAHLKLPDATIKELRGFEVLPDFPPPLKFELSKGQSFQIILTPSKDEINFEIEVE